MTKQEVISKLEAIFHQELKNPYIRLSETSTADQVEGWDSLTNMIIIARVEEVFDCKFKFREIVKLRNIGDLCEAILTQKN